MAGSKNILFYPEHPSDEKTHALLIFPNEDHYTKVQVGDTVIVSANYLVMTNLYGIVMKNSELISVKRKK